VTAKNINALTLLARPDRSPTQIQSFWTDQAEKVSSLYPQAVWRVLNSVLDQSKLTQNKVLQAVIPVLEKDEQKLWPTTRKQIDAKLKRSVGVFHARVTRRKSIDLSHIGLQGLQDPIEFKFLDPVYCWAVCANDLSQEHTLHFQSTVLRHPVTGESLYGASVQHGRLMKRACDKTPIW
jgi:hypothetical protein